MLSNVKPRDDCVWGYGLSGVGRCSLLSSLVTSGQWISSCISIVWRVALRVRCFVEWVGICWYEKIPRCYLSRQKQLNEVFKGTTLHIKVH